MLAKVIIGAGIPLIVVIVIVLFFSQKSKK